MRAKRTSFAGDVRKAEAYLTRAVAVDSGIIIQFTARAAAIPLAYLYWQSGRRAEALPLLELGRVWAQRRIAQSRELWGSYYGFAAVQQIQGDTAEARRWLAAAVDAGMPVSSLVRRDPIFASVRETSWFRSAMNSIYWRIAEMRRRLQERGLPAK